MKNTKKFKKAIENADKKSLTVYIIVRFLIIVCLIMQIIHKEWNNAFLCLLTLILITMPFIFEKHFKIELPNTLETIIILFIFAAEILGEINNFYNTFKHWDTMLHTLNGFICAGIGFSLVDLLNKNSKKINLSPAYLLLVSFTFSMTIGVMWEFCEYTMDKVFLMDAQKDHQITTISSTYLNETGENKSVILKNIEYTKIYSQDEDGNLVETTVGGYLDIGLNDTMKDLLVNFLGAIIFNLIAYLYIKNNQKWQFVEGFIPTKTN
ncbi:MAG: hypothetical protein ACI4WU_02875 [Bacilli bacterium]